MCIAYDECVRLNGTILIQVNEPTAYGSNVHKMLRDLNVEQARFIALLSRTARTQRDALLGNVAEQDLGGLTPGRGEHNPAADLGLEPVPADNLQIAALREAIASLSETGRQELYSLVRVGQGHLGAANWRRGLSEAQALGDSTITAALIDDPDLHDHIAKGLYEAKLSF